MHMLNRHLEPIKLLFGLFKLGTLAILLLVGFLTFLISTEPGTKLLIDFVLSKQNIQMEHQQLQGSLIRGVHAQNLTLKSDDFRFFSQKLSISINPNDIIRGHYRLEELAIQNGQLVINQQDANPNGFDINNETLKKLISTENIRYFPNASIDNFSVVIQDKSIHTKKLTFSINQDGDEFTSFDYQGDLGWAHFNPNMQKATWHIDSKQIASPILNPTQKFQSQGQILLNDETIKAKFTLDNIANVKHFDMSLSGDLANHYGNLRLESKDISIQTRFNGQLKGRKWNANLSDSTLKSKNALTILTQGKITANISLSQTRFDAYVYQHNRMQRFTGKLGIKNKFYYAVHGNGSIDATSLNPLQNMGKFNSGVINYQVDLSHKADQAIRIYAAGNNIDYKPKNWPNSIMVDKLVISPKTNGFDIQGNGKINQGQFNITGHGQLAPKFVGHVKITGKNIQLANSQDFNMQVSPDLTITAEKGLSINGSVIVNEANIRSNKYISSHNHSGDVVIKQKQTTQSNVVPKLNIPLSMNVDVTLLDKVHYQGYGLETYVSGNIKISKSNQEKFTAKGSLKLSNGKFKAHNKQFDLQDGSLIFDGGPITNPILDIKAQRKVRHVGKGDDITVGLKIQGKIKSPKIKPFSMPAMSEADTLSYLILDRPANDLSNQQGEFLLQAVDNIGNVFGRDDIKLVQTLQKELHIDHIGVKRIRTNNKNSSETLEDTMLVIGKQLSDNFYLQYGFNLGESKNQMGFTYYINKHLSLEAHAGPTGSQADLLLNFEGG